MALWHHLSGASESCPSWYQQGLYVIGAQPPLSNSINTPLAPWRSAVPQLDSVRFRLAADRLFGGTALL
eukprot:972473-Rhodomonas_salina.1